MDVTPTTATTNRATSSTTTSNKASDSASSGGLTADFDTFLKLLTTQLKYQDPLQPMESTEFVAQLASFSAVEQQIGSNTRLDSILFALGGGMEGVADWIGRSVQAPTGASFTGDPIAIGATPASGADSAVLVVKNDFGAEVARVAIDPTASAVSWDGTDASGATVATGTYTFALESYSGETLLSTSAGQVYATVTEARRAEGGGVELVLETGDTIAAEDVTAIRGAAT
jgi:flagellar basal-body rod modification protein FlgD